MKLLRKIVLYVLYVLGAPVLGLVLVAFWGDRGPVFALVSLTAIVVCLMLAGVVICYPQESGPKEQDNP